MLLGALTLLIDFTIGLVLGVWTALHPDTVRSPPRAISAVTIGYTLPSFVIGTALVWFFAVHVGWLPSGLMADPLLPARASRFPPTIAATPAHGTCCCPWRP